jgi:hypothetical protein
MKKHLTILALFVCLALDVRHAVATSTGLNNIPTADAPGDGEFVIQEINTIATEGRDDFTAGFKMGLRPWGQRFEWGLDSHFAPGGAGPAVFQAKYAFQPWEDWPTLGIGAANIATNSDDRKLAGGEFKFAVLSYEVKSQESKWFRLHAGYGLQTQNNAMFFGVDKTFKVFNRGLMLRSDAIEIQDRSQWLASFGGIYFLHKHIALESWFSQPTDHGEPSVVVKLNFIFKFW